MNVNSSCTIYTVVVMCDNSSLTITATLHINGPTKAGLPRYMPYDCKGCNEYLLRSHCPRLNQLIFSKQFQLFHCGTAPFLFNNVTMNSLSQNTKCTPINLNTTFHFAMV